MKNSGFLLSLFLIVAGFFVGCKDTNQVFSPGTGDPRVVGTWQLVERRFLRDSTYSIQRDSIKITRDTSYYVTRQYALTPLQTLTFGSDGNLSASGSEMTYYNPIHYFRVDSTVITFYITTNHANVPFQQRVVFMKDTLQLNQSCDQPCYLKFLRVR